MRYLFPPFLSGRAAVGLLAVRLVVGVAFVLHGWGKIQSPGGPTGWMGPEATIPGPLLAIAAFSEFLGGAALVAGLLTPLASLALVGTMIGAVHHHVHSEHSFVNPSGPSYELAAAYLAANFLLLMAGPGLISLDALLFRGRPATKSPGQAV